MQKLLIILLACSLCVFSSCGGGGEDLSPYEKALHKLANANGSPNRIGTLTYINTPEDPHWENESHEPATVLDLVQFVKTRGQEMGIDYSVIYFSDQGIIKDSQKTHDEMCAISKGFIRVKKFHNGGGGWGITAVYKETEIYHYYGSLD